MTVLREYYKISINWKGKKYLGLDSIGNTTIERCTC